MTDEQWEELGQRAVACRRWRWMPGMLDSDGNRLIAKGDGTEWYCADTSAAEHFAFSDDVCHELDESEFGFPDIRDPATLGCLLALVREAWGDPHGYVFSLAVEAWNGEGGDYSTEAEALIAALEAAP